MDSRKSSVLALRSDYLKECRDFFYKNEFLEVTTPQLVPNPGLEIHLNYFKTEFIPDLGGGKRRTFFLPTSPEYHLKKALSWGVPRIFEITKCFRNGEITSEHEPEFLMLEWYRAPGQLQEVAQDAQSLIKKLASKFSQEASAWQNSEHLHLNQLFKEHCGMSLETLIDKNSADFDDEFSRFFVERIEPALAQKNLVFLWGFPASQAALAQKNLKDPRFADRFEIYFRGLELANAFQELLDPQEQRQRFEQELLHRQKTGKDCPPIDEELLNALKTIRSPAGGIALGLERLLQALKGAQSLSEILAFSHQTSI